MQKWLNPKNIFDGTTFEFSSPIDQLLNSTLNAKAINLIIQILKNKMIISGLKFGGVHINQLLF